MKASKKSRPARSQSFPSWGWAVIGVVVLAAAAAVFVLNRPGPQAAEITVAEAVQKRQAGALILDVREPEEWQEYHVPDSTHIPLGELAKRVNEVPRDREIVVVCRSGNRSKAGSEILLKAGFTRVSSMAGGLKEWKAAGYPTTGG